MDSFYKFERQYLKDRNMTYDDLFYGVSSRDDDVRRALIKTYSFRFGRDNKSRRDAAKHFRCSMELINEIFGRSYFAENRGQA